jgi:Tir chaperone protein (CesT) family
VKLDKCIEQLVKDMELESGLTTKVPGVFAFPVEENLSIMIEDRPPGFALSCKLGDVPKQKQEEFFTRVMMGNLFGQGTKGAVLGIHEDGDVLTLTLVVDYNAEYKEFRDILEDFANSVDFWYGEVRSYS